MAYDLSNYLVIGVSSRALFDLTVENEIYENNGLEAYCQYQLDHEDDILKPGTGFALINSMLHLNVIDKNTRRIEVVIISRNSADTSLRISNSIDFYNLDITRAAFTSGEPVAKYLNAFDVDLFLSATEEDVQSAVESNVAAGLIYDGPTSNPQNPLEQIRIAFDGDAVLFSEESEMIYQEQGLEAFIEHEKINAEKPLPEGPFAKLLKTISFLQFELNSGNQQQLPPIRTALVTARNSPAHERVIRTLRTWNVRIDETFFLGGVAKDKILAAFSPHIFFDDQHQHCDAAARLVPTARVPYKTGDTKTAKSTPTQS
ncbi:MAG: 5'-nucleotidase [Gammaproteobacteria bacterium]|nr:5'-nucleotidase [Gammaproteobacteria bacterium]MCZ6669029.1 5'-nucleotidase [Gammaproteobacteria bacterium]MCZ6798241.1 5'-nucleotidase [Gammaproteobacteria bacterium]